MSLPAPLAVYYTVGKWKKFTIVQCSTLAQMTKENIQIELMLVEARPVEVNIIEVADRKAMERTCAILHLEE